MKAFKKILAVVLCFTLLLAPVTIGASAKDYSNKTVEQIEAEGRVKTKFLSWLVGDFLLGTIAKIIPNLDFVGEDSDKFHTDNFYEGNTYMDPNTDDYTWKLGYSEQSIVPEDFGVPFKYARGSYAPWGYSTGYYTDEDGNDEKMMVRTILLDDCTGRGLIAICSVDCIGISNVDCKKIRAGIADFAKANNIVAVEISAIHSHMAIDSQGVWNAPLTTVANNLLSKLGLTETKSGVNKDYLNKIIDSTAVSIKDAFKDLKAGKLEYTNIDVDGYMGARTVSRECDDDIHKLMFTPDDGSRGTLVASFGAHPELTSYGHEFDGRLSSDFVYFMEKLVNKSGNNFMYIQGNVGTNSVGTSKSDDGLSLEKHEKAMRYGYEMAYICLGASMNKEERMALNDQLGDKLGIKEYGSTERYTNWYDNLDTFVAQPVNAVMNIRHKQVKLEIENTTSIVLLKLGLASNMINYNKSNGKYYTETEIGYLELGNVVKAFLSPGELYSELYVGGYGLEQSAIKSLRESYGEDVILFDLMNDAAGYVCPDETYAVLSYRYDPINHDLYDDTWCLTVSIGKNTASTLMNGYADIMNSIKK